MCVWFVVALFIGSPALNKTVLQASRAKKIPLFVSFGFFEYILFLIQSSSSFFFTQHDMTESIERDIKKN